MAQAAGGLVMHTYKTSSLSVIDLGIEDFVLSHQKASHAVASALADAPRKNICHASLHQLLCYW
jgi:hypothetical protein